MPSNGAKVALAAVVFLVGFVLAWYLKPDGEPVVVSEWRELRHGRDTLYLETVRQPVYVTNLVPFERPQDSNDTDAFGPAVMPDTLPDPYVDTLVQVFGPDTVGAAYAWPQRRFSLTLRPGPDTVAVVTDTLTVERIVERSRRQPIGLGFFGGYGFALDGRPAGWTVGVGVSFNLLTIGP